VLAGLPSFLIYDPHLLRGSFAVRSASPSWDSPFSCHPRGFALSRSWIPFFFGCLLFFGRGSDVQFQRVPSPFPFWLLFRVVLPRTGFFLFFRGCLFFFFQLDSSLPLRLPFECPFSTRVFVRNSSPGPSFLAGSAGPDCLFFSPSF